MYCILVFVTGDMKVVSCHPTSLQSDEVQGGTAAGDVVSGTTVPAEVDWNPSLTNLARPSSKAKPCENVIDIHQRTFGDDSMERQT